MKFLLIIFTIFIVDGEPVIEQKIHNYKYKWECWDKGVNKYTKLRKKYKDKVTIMWQCIDKEEKMLWNLNKNH